MLPHSLFRPSPLLTRPNEPLADAVLSTRGSSFSIINFRMLFVLVFARLVLTALQVVLSFHGLRNQAKAVGLYSALFVISIGKIVGGHKVIAEPSGSPRVVQIDLFKCVGGDKSRQTRCVIGRREPDFVSGILAPHT